MTVAGAVLAAGLGSRFGGAGAKPLAAFAGRPLVSWALDAMRASGVSPTLLVIGADGDDVARVAPADVTVLPAPDWHRGIAHSLNAALDAVTGDPVVSALCVGLADQPLVSAQAYRRLVRAHENGAAFAVATYQDVRANPVLLGREIWPAVRRLQGDAGARALMAEHAVVEVDCTGVGDPRDVDTLDDLRALEEELTGDEP